MARGGLYKSDVEKVRNSLIAQGINPSIDVVRSALGNTGSRTTIHRYLKELDAEDPQLTRGDRLEGAIGELVGRLAGQLGQDADDKVAQARSHFDAELASRTEALARSKADSARLSEQLQRTEVALHDEQAGHATTRQELAEALTSLRQLNERIEGLIARIAEGEAHTQSLEEKHLHAREALEHFRTSVKEQRDQEQRRHEHQLAELQTALRQVNETLAAKNQDLLQLNRDSVRLTEKTGQLDNELHRVRTDLREREHELKSLRPLVAENKALQTRCAAAESRAAGLDSDLTALRAQLETEREARRSADSSADRAATRLTAVDEMLAKLDLRELVVAAAKDASARSGAATPTG